MAKRKGLLVTKWLVDHPKVNKFSELIKKSKQESIGYLIHYWLFVDTYLPDGNLSKYHPNEIEVIEDGCGWTGDEGDLYGALIDCGFINQTEEGFVCIFI